MLCRICNTPHNNKSFCSYKCRVKWLTENNKTNNPIWDISARDKMVLGKKGQRPSEQTRLKMSASQKAFHKQNPDVKLNAVKIMHEKYTNKIAGTGYDKIRLRVLERDGYLCQSCNVNKTKLIVHHIDWRGKRRNVPISEWNNEMSNLITLCIKCHNAHHRHKANDYNIRKMRMQSPWVKLEAKANDQPSQPVFYIKTQLPVRRLILSSRLAMPPLVFRWPVEPTKQSAQP